ncbi:Mor transcription activator family protein [Luteimonas terricola]|uniref:Mor transcription activator domain-containing protein n=2 Tax=Luteimonas terricola TaxID=645597 RepID=A0ABQ2EEA0_9GAMM|nr:Mor transcription activator family protein [Luteimonas terricola]GGK08870.1 hypothetical protein GCM10011394_17900 [Luteimonas terricola]
MVERRAEFLTDVAAAAADRAREFGMPADQAEQIGAAIADMVAEDWGGQVLSIPKDHAYQLAQRDRQILLAHRNGASFAKLAKEYGMSDRGVRRLLRRAELRDPDLRQAQLFAIGSGR